VTIERIAIENRAIEKHNRLSLIEVLPGGGAGKHKIGLWKCDCGETKAIKLCRVRLGTTKSCGCIAIEIATKSHTIHGMRNSPEYISWQSMIARCCNPNNQSYWRYGGAGITICDEWRSSFDAFFAYVGPRPNGMSIDRIDGLVGYHPGNVRWATAKIQSQNRSCVVIVSTPLGVMPLVDYASMVGLSRGAAHLRFKRGKLEGVSYAD